MKYNYDGKTYNIPDKEIDNLVNNLEVSIAEACEIYLTDKEIISNETVENLTKNAEKNRITQTIHQARDKKKTKKAPKKKENPLKREIIFGIFDYFHDEIGHSLPKDTKISIKNEEKYIDFTIDGREFTLNLVEHRPKKKSE